MKHGDWVERYRRGEREAVWSELRLLGSAVRDPLLLEEAQAVCDQMALRARFNIEMLVERLTSQGFLFHSNDDQRIPVCPFQPANPAARRLVTWL